MEILDEEQVVNTVKGLGEIHESKYYSMRSALVNIRMDKVEHPDEVVVMELPLRPPQLAGLRNGSTLGGSQSHRHPSYTLLKNCVPEMFSMSNSGKKE